MGLDHRGVAGELPALSSAQSCGPAPAELPCGCKPLGSVGEPRGHLWVIFWWGVEVGWGSVSHLLPKNLLSIYYV